MKRKGNHSNFIRETCIAGACIDVTMKFSSKNRTGERAANTNPSPEAVVINNDRIAAKTLTRLMNANMYPGDWHATYTYAGDEPSAEEAKRELDNFIKRMKREYKKIGKEFKYITVTEYKHQRIHHHMVMSYIDERIIEKQWKRGHVRLVALDRSRNYKKLAEYFLKETTKTLRDPKSATKKRWSASRNLTRPIVKREKVQPSAMYQKPKALKGYEIVEDSIRQYEHPTTGIEHLEYMMISTDPVPRLKTWRSGKIVKRDETYRRAAAIQISMDELEGWDFI